MSEWISLSVKSWQYRDRRKPEVGTMPYSHRMMSRVSYHFIVYNTIDNCTCQAFEQFGALYMHNLDNKYPTRPGFEPSTAEFRATNRSNKLKSDRQSPQNVDTKLKTVGLIMDQHRRRWADITPSLCECFVFSGGRDPTFSPSSVFILLFKAFTSSCWTSNFCNSNNHSVS